MPDIFSPGFADDPYPAYCTMRDAHPLYFHGPSQAWILSRFDDVHAALTNPVFTTRSYAAQTEPLLGRTIIQLDGREHNIQRNLLIQPFRAASIQQRWKAVIETSSTARRRPARAPGALPRARLRGAAAGADDGGDPRPAGRDGERFRRWYTGLIRGALNLRGDPEVARDGETRARRARRLPAPLIAKRVAPATI